MNALWSKPGTPKAMDLSKSLYRHGFVLGSLFMITVHFRGGYPLCSTLHERARRPTDALLSGPTSAVVPCTRGHQHTLPSILQIHLEATHSTSSPNLFRRKSTSFRNAAGILKNVETDFLCRCSYALYDSHTTPVAAR